MHHFIDISRVLPDGVANPVVDVIESGDTFIDYPLIIALAVAALLVIFAAVMTVIIIRRRKRSDVDVKGNVNGDGGDISRTGTGK